jgi:hypothetical protein
MRLHRFFHARARRLIKTMASIPNLRWIDIHLAMATTIPGNGFWSKLHRRFLRDTPATTLGAVNYQLVPSGLVEKRFDHGLKTTTYRLTEQGRIFSGTLPA